MKVLRVRAFAFILRLCNVILLEQSIQYLLDKKRTHLYQIFNESPLKSYQTPQIKSLMWSQNVRHSSCSVIKTKRVPFNQDNRVSTMQLTNARHKVQIKYIKIAPIPRFQCLLWTHAKWRTRRTELSCFTVLTLTLFLSLDYKVWR